MQKYVCDACGYVYDPELGDPENGIEPGTSFEDLPEDWVCPECNVGKDQFSPEDQSASHQSILLILAKVVTRYITAKCDRTGRILLGFR